MQSGKGLDLDNDLRFDDEIRNVIADQPFLVVYLEILLRFKGKPHLFKLAFKRTLIHDFFVLALSADAQPSPRQRCGT